MVCSSIRKYVSVTSIGSVAAMSSAYRADCNVVSSPSAFVHVHVYCCHLELASQGLSPRDDGCRMVQERKHMRIVALAGFLVAHEPGNGRHSFSGEQQQVAEHCPFRVAVWNGNASADESMSPSIHLSRSGRYTWQ